MKIFEQKYTSACALFFQTPLKQLVKHSQVHSFLFCAIYLYFSKTMIVSCGKNAAISKSAGDYTYTYSDTIHFSLVLYQI